MKKIFTLLWGICLIALSAISCTFAYTQEQQEAYQWAYKYGITTQPTIEAANLNWKVTRQAFAKMVINYLENAVWIKQNISDSCSFPDETKITNDLKPFTKKTCAYKIMWSDWTAFKPTDPVDRAQLGTVLSRVLRWDTYNSNGSQYYIYHLNALKQNGIMNKIDNPKVHAKRWEVMIMLKRIYEKYGSNLNINNNTSSAYELPVNNDSDNDLLSNIYANSNIVYTWKDWTKYYYDAKLLNMLKDKAHENWESDLEKYLEIEAEYFKNWLDEIANLDDDKISEMLGVDLDKIDIEKLSKKEKEKLIKTLKEWMDKVLKDNEKRNNNFINNIEKITSKIQNDKFNLKEKFNKSKTFIDTTNSFLASYYSIIYEALDVTLNEKEMNDNEKMEMALWLMWWIFTYSETAKDYQEYIENWAKDTIISLWLESNNANQNNNQWNNTETKTKNTDSAIEDSHKTIKSVVENMIKNNPIKWDKNARFTIVEYTELLCPYCQRHSFQGTIDAVIQQFPNDVNSISRHFIIHWDSALQLASAMECISELKPDIYYKTFEKAFEAYPVDMDSLVNIASEFGINKTSLQSCIDDGKYIKAIEDMMNEGNQLFWVNGTPGNVIIDRQTGNYVLVSGAYPVDEFIKAINELKNS